VRQAETRSSGYGKVRIGEEGSTQKTKESIQEASPSNQRTAAREITTKTLLPDMNQTESTASVLYLHNNNLLLIIEMKLQNKAMPAPSKVFCWEPI